MTNTRLDVEMDKHPTRPQSPVVQDEELLARLVEAEETLEAIRSGSVDALVVYSPEGEQVYTLTGADHTYRRLVEAMREGAVVLTAEGDILYCNRCFADMVGLPLERVMGGPLRQFFSEADQADVEALLASGLQGSSTFGKQEFVLRTADGEGVPAYLSVSALSIGDVSTLCLVVTDLTEQKRAEQKVVAGMKRLEEEQLKANKLESIGILAGGLAHDLNNSLTAILGNISLAKRSLRSSGDAVTRLAEAEMACLQARDVTQQLLTFSKGGVPIKEPVSIAQLLRDWAGFAVAGSNVNCDIDLPPDLLPVEIDKGQMSRVINNLVINAQQAMPEGGTVTIRGANITLGPDWHEHALPLPPGEYVRIAIQDTGTGIPASHLSKIFDPYFTTKQKGSGLGLSIAYSIVKAHEGYITAESQIGAGTTFHIYLPASGGAPSAQANAPEAAQEGTLKVLVVDDQESIREVIRTILTDLEGDEVDFASDGQRAIELYKAAREAGQPYDVVMMDLTIPGGMGGKEGVKRLLEIDPNAKVIVVSGYSNDPIMSQYWEYGFKGVIRKPFEIDELVHTVHSVVAASKPG